MSQCMKLVFVSFTQLHNYCHFTMFARGTLCKIGGFLDLRPWKPVGNLTRSLVGTLRKSKDTACLQRKLVET